METIRTTNKVKGLIPGLAPSVVFILTYVLARVILKMEYLESAMRVLAALLPIPPFSYWLWIFVRSIRRADELEQRIHLEALALAFPLALILLMTLGLLELAIKLPPEDLSYRHVWMFLPLFYFVGLALARRRYQ